VHDAGAICGELLRPVRRQHRSLAHAGDVDYDARAHQQLGSGLITLEGFDDNYNYNEQKGPGAAIGPYGPGPNYLDLYGNRGYLLSDDFAMSKNDFGFGYKLAAPGQYQRIVPLHAGERNDL